MATVRSPIASVFEYAHECVSRWGSFSLAYSLLQPGLEYFVVDGLGVIAYRKALGIPVVLADPLCATADAEMLVQEFTETYPNAHWAQVSEDTATILHANGYFITPFGTDMELDIAAFSLAGKSKADLRHYRNSAQRHGLEVWEAADSPQLRSELHAISAPWLTTKPVSRREMTFLARPLAAGVEEDVRIFVVAQGRRKIGFILLDPMCAPPMCAPGERRIDGYSVAFQRALPASPDGTLPYAVLYALERLREEGYRRLNLGLMPLNALDGLATAHGCLRTPSYWALQFFGKYGGAVFNSRSLSFHKTRYRGKEIPVFAASRTPIGIYGHVATLRACGIV